MTTTYTRPSWAVRRVSAMLVRLADLGVPLGSLRRIRRSQPVLAVIATISIIFDPRSAMWNTLGEFLPWRRLIAMLVVLPLIGVLVVLAFAWPAARIGPRDLPVGVVGASPAAQQAVAGLTRSEPGGFSFRRYPGEAAARSAIEHRDIYGAFVISPSRVTALGASAASPTVAQLLTAAGQQLASHAPAHTAAAGQPRPVIQVRSVDVVGTSASDPRGLVLGVAPLPLTIVGVMMAAAIMLVARFRPAWRQLAALAVVSAGAGLGAYLIVQDFLGALPGGPAATWASLSLTLLAVSTSTAGLIALFGPVGLAAGAGLMIVVGNAFSGATSAPQLLPAAAGRIGQWLPAGAGGNLLRSTAYFNGNGAAGHLSVLIIWSVLGLAAIVAGQRFRSRFAAGPARNPPVASSPTAGYDRAAGSSPVPGPEPAECGHAA